MVKGQRLANFCCIEPKSKCFELCKLCDQCCNCLNLALEVEGIFRQYVNKCVPMELCTQIPHGTVVCQPPADGKQGK